MSLEIFAKNIIVDKQYTRCAELQEGYHKKILMMLLMPVIGDHWSCDATSGTLRDMQRHLVNVAAICVATGSDIEICFTNSP